MADTRDRDVVEAEYQKFLGISFALHGLLPPTTSEYFVFQRVARESPIPSPFAQNMGPEYRKSLQKMSRPVVSAFDQIKRMKVANVRNRPVCKDGSVALFGMILRRKKGASQVDTPEASLRAFPIEMDHDQFLVPILDDAKERSLLIQRANPRYGTQTCYFLVNIRFQNLFVNGQRVSEGTILGPLPDFAVIDCDGFPIFWWKTKEAFDYTPGSSPAYPQGQFQRGSFDQTSEQSATDVPATPSDQLSTHQGPTTRSVAKNIRAAGNFSRETSQSKGPSTVERRPHAKSAPTTRQLLPKSTLFIPAGAPELWARIYEEGLERHRTAHRRAKLSKEQPHFIPRESNLSDEDLIFAIGSMWAAVHAQTRIFAFAGMDVFAQNENTPYEARLRNIGVVGGHNDFIMPLLLHAQKRPGAAPVSQTQSVGHIVLCRVHLVNIRDNIYDLDIYDSASGLVSHDEIMGTVMRLLTGANWPWPVPPEGFQLPRPQFTAPHYHSVPQQHQISNTCGLHTILNAYALLLGVPITPDPDCIALTSPQDFYEQGLEIINLALAGHMDSLTIMAFMNVWSYTPIQALPFSYLQGNALPPLKSLPAPPVTTENQDTGTSIRQVTAQKMNGAILVDLLQNERKFDCNHSQSNFEDALAQENQQALVQSLAGTGAHATTGTQSSHRPIDPNLSGLASRQQGHNVSLEPFRSTTQQPGRHQPRQPRQPRQPSPTFEYPDPSLAGWAQQPTGQSYDDPLPHRANYPSLAPYNSAQLAPRSQEQSLIQRLIEHPAVQQAAARSQSQTGLDELAYQALQAAGGDFDTALEDMTTTLGLQQLISAPYDGQDPSWGNYDPTRGGPSFVSLPLTLTGPTLRSGKRLRGRAPAPTPTSAGFRGTRSSDEGRLAKKARLAAAPPKPAKPGRGLPFRKRKS